MMKFSKLDAADTVWFSRQLESIDQTNYQNLVPGILGRTYLPSVDNVAPWAKVYTYRQYRLLGRSKFSGPNSDDAPRATVVANETSQNIKELTDSYGWTQSEIRAARGTGVDLDTMTVAAARMAIENQIDELLALGSSVDGIQGLLKLTGVDSPDSASGKTSGNTWAANASTDAAKILADINTMTVNMFTALQQANNLPGFQKFTMLVPMGAFAAIATTPRSTTSDTTILKYALANNPWLESIEPWRFCDHAAANDTDGRAVLYARNPICLGALLPRDFTSEAPQERNFDVVVPASAACGGVVCRYPVAVRYMDGI